jgi:Spy/CpxP family protein refolding chaperone
MRIQPTAALALLALVLATPAAFAQDPAQGPDDPAPRGMPDGPSRHHMGGGERGEGHDWGGGERGWGREGDRGEGWGRGRGMRGRGGDRGFMLARLVSNPEIREKLGVTAEQAAKIRQQTSDFRKAQIRSRAELSVKRIELRDLLSAENPDRPAIDKKLQEISAARLAQQKTAIDFGLTMRTALTPEQREKLKKMREEFRGRGRGGPGRDGARGPRGPRGGEHRGGPGATPPAKSQD